MPWLDTGIASLHYEICGDATTDGAPPLVLLHEMGGCLESWTDVVDLLPGRHVIRFDQRGAGLSEKIVGAVRLDDLVTDLTALLDALRLSQPVALAGCAVGAAVALAFAARNPGRVTSLVAMSPATGIAPARRAATLELADSFERDGVRTRILQRLDHAFPARYRTDPARVARFAGIMLANDPHSYAAWYRMLAGIDLSADLPRLACACLVLAGETDTTRPPAMVEAVAAAIPGARFKVVASGHVMPMLTPEVVAAELRAFPPKPGAA